jgi:hypothetical protein
MEPACDDLHKPIWLRYRRKKPAGVNRRAVSFKRSDHPHALPGDLRDHIVSSKIHHGSASRIFRISSQLFVFCSIGSTLLD